MTESVHVQVSPPQALSSRQRLFSALAEAFGVTFGVGANTADPDTLALECGERRLVLHTRAPDNAGAAQVTIARHSAVDSRLRGRILNENGASSGEVRPAEGAVVLARVGRAALWTTVSRPSGHLDEVAFAPAELPPDAPLRAEFRPGRFLALLPVIHFLRSISVEQRWVPPPLRAAFIIDDPNLHFPSYGYIDFGELALDARRNGYHVAMAMVPLDTWFAHPRAVRLFRANEAQLSLLMHGNNHVRRELAIPRDDPSAAGLFAQALRRVTAFEQRSNLKVSRVMAPPHGACSEQSARAMLRAGIEGLCVSRPFPWLDTPPGERVLAGWSPSEFVADGLPVIPRLHIRADCDELILRAYLDQPLILYGHHKDLAAGPGILAAAADVISSFGEVSWSSLTDISRANVAWRLRGETLELRLFSRRARISAPPGTKKIVVSAPDSRAETGAVYSLDRRIPVKLGEPIAAPQADMLEIRLDNPPAPAETYEPSASVFPMVRRVAVESRDRARPFLPRRVVR